TAPTSAGTYAIVATITDPNFRGTTSGTLTINKAAATTTLSTASLNQTYDGAPKFVIVTTAPADLTTSLVYTQNGAVVSAPTDAGSYSVTATVTDPNYEGAASGTLIINKATPT